METAKKFQKTPDTDKILSKITGYHLCFILYENWLATREYTDDETLQRWKKGYKKFRKIMKLVKKGS